MKNNTRKLLLVLSIENENNVDNGTHPGFSKGGANRLMFSFFLLSLYFSAFI